LFAAAATMPATVRAMTIIVLQEQAGAQSSWAIGAWLAPHNNDHPRPIGGSAAGVFESDGCNDTGVETATLIARGSQSHW